MKRLLLVCLWAPSDACGWIGEQLGRFNRAAFWEWHPRTLSDWAGGAVTFVVSGFLVVALVSPVVLLIAWLVSLVL